MWSDQSNVLWRERSKGVVVLWEWVIDERFDFVCVCVWVEGSSYFCWGKQKT